MPQSLPMVMVRFSEIAIKGAKTRHWLTNRLVSHINYMLNKQNIEDFEIIKEYSRIFVKSSENKKVENIIASLIPGAVSVSEVYQCSSEINEIKTCLKKSFFSKIDKEKSFAVKVKRTGNHPYSSVELGAILGEFILENNIDKHLKVNLTKPEYTLRIEVRENKAYIFDEIKKGLGGLPVGSQGKVLVLVSGIQEDISNIIQLYKRGAITLIYSLLNESNLDTEFKETVIRIQNMQPYLKEIGIFYIKDKFDVDNLIDLYRETECLGIAMSKTVFNDLEKELPVKVPIFVPHLVDIVDEKELSKVLATTI